MSKHLQILLAMAFASIQTLAQENDGKVIIRLNLDKAELKIQDIPGSVDIAGQDLNHKTLDIVGSRDYFNLLEQEGYPVEIVREQTQALDERYMRPEKIIALVQELQHQFPDLVYVEKVGESLQGRPIVAVRLSTFENADFKPSILFNGMHHAREIMTTEVTTDIMVYILKNAHNPNTPWVEEWLKHLAIWVLPQFNPDGNEIVWTSDNWWRKNARGDGRGEIFGVDLNRNYPYEWASCGGSSGSRGNQTYHGDSAASEPETQAMMKFVKDKNFAIDVSYHSYSEIVIGPYGCQSHYTPENAIVQKIGQDFAQSLKSDDGKGSYKYGTGWELLYPVDGDDISWMYKEVNTLSYVVEMNSSSLGFQPDYGKWRTPTVEKQRAGWQFMLNRLLLGPQVRGRMLDAKTGAPVNGSVIISGVEYKDEKPRMAKAGIYQKILIPGDYELIFSAPGYQSQTLAVSVADRSVVVQDVYFEGKTSILGD